MKRTLLLLYSALLSVAISAQNLNDSLVAEFNFNGNMDDVSGNGYHLTGSNVTPTLDRNGNLSAYLFNGSNSFMKASNPNPFYNDQYTISV